MQQLKKLDDRVWVAGQLTPHDMPELAGRGFRTIINNRPDGEARDQPTSRQIETAARAAGLDYVHVPLRPPELSRDHVTRFAAALNGAGGPLLAFCRSGKRSAILWALASAPSRPVADILATAAAAGYDLSKLAPMLSRFAA